MPYRDTDMRRQNGMHGIPLVRRGLHLLGLAIGIAMTWYVASWIIHGRQPLDAHIPVAGPLPGAIRISIDEDAGCYAPILPPAWLLAILGLLTLAAFAMMFVGLQDINPRLRKNTPDTKPLNP